MPDAVNPFFSRSTLPHELPPFAAIHDEHYEPAFERGFEEQLAEVAAITADPEAPTFENTLEPLERSGQLLVRVARVFFNKQSADSGPVTNELEERIAPRLTAHEDAIRLDGALYERISALFDARDTLDLTPEQRYLLERHHTEMTLAGAGLGDADKGRLRDYNTRLATLTTRFEKNLLSDTNELAVVIDDIADLDGLDAGATSAAAQAAKQRGLPGGYLLTLPLFTGHPYLAQLTNRSVRERIMRASRARGARGGDYDNRALVLEITKLRAERAALLGFESHAAYKAADQTAGTPAAVVEMLSRLAPPAARNALQEQEALEEEAGVRVEAWDWAFYSERVRTRLHDVDLAAMRPYFEAERVLRDGVFFAATRLYGITFAERGDLEAYHPDARVFEVSNEDGSPLGLFVLDLYTRDTKRGGAWMNELVGQAELLDVPTSVVVNNLNVPKPSSGPTLLSYDETRTLFHEFGHALHGLFAHVVHPKFTGTSVYRDFVEFPSQVNEMWMLWPEVLSSYAVHHETGEPLPAALVTKLQESSAYGEGFATSEYLAAALLDQAWHAIGADAAITDVEEFEAQALASVGLDNPAVPTRYSSTYFAHTFAGGYDAGYYSYIWSEVLDADTVEWFEQHGGLTRENGDRFRSLVLGIGGSRDPLDAYREFRGRDAAVEPLLKRRGLN
jgi:peptidyl-dipeptidase Dcp